MSVVAGFDIDSRCKETYERNNRPARFYEADITRMDAAMIWRSVGTHPKSDILLAGCAPCQPFSQYKNGNQHETGQNALKRDPDSKLLGAFARLVELIRPGQVLVENVPGLTWVQGFSTYRRFLQMLRTLGYSVAEAVLDAKTFGVPQTRRRYVLIAIRGKRATLPEPVFGPGLASYSTVRDAISHFPPIRAGERHPFVLNHETAIISEINLKRLSHTPHDGGDRRA